MESNLFNKNKNLLLKIVILMKKIEITQYLKNPLQHPKSYTVTKTTQNHQLHFKISQFTILKSIQNNNKEFNSKKKTV